MFFSASGLPIDAVRTGLFIGGFSGLYNGLRCLLNRSQYFSPQLSVLISGAIASLSILWSDRSNHRTIALYLLARVCQCWYNWAKERGNFHFAGSKW